MNGNEKNTALGVSNTQSGHAGGKNLTPSIASSNIADFVSNCQGQSLEKVIASINERFGEGSVMRLGKAPQSQPALSTGLPALDTARGIGGVPRGRIVEIFGGEAAGKTSLALQIARRAENALYIDADHGIPAARMAGMTIASVDTLEDALNVCEIAAGAFDLIVIDTLAALPTKAELAAPLECRDYKNSAAVLLSRTLPRLMHSLAKNNCTLIVVNQMRENPAVIFGNPEKTTGGRALKYYAAIRFRVSRREFLMRKQEVIGQKIRVEVVKNKCAPPFGMAEPLILFDRVKMVEKAVG